MDERMVRALEKIARELRWISLLLVMVLFALIGAICTMVLVAL